MDETPSDVDRLVGTLMEAAGLQFAGGFALGLEAAARHPEWLAAMARQFVGKLSTESPSGGQQLGQQLVELVRLFPVSEMEPRPERGGLHVV